MQTSKLVAQILIRNNKYMIISRFWVRFWKKKIGLIGELKSIVASSLLSAATK